jgi:hypothetical protein
MQDSFTLVQSCLQHWEFCPLCDKRNNIEIGFLEGSSRVQTNYETVITNSDIGLAKAGGSMVFNICLNENKVNINKVAEGLQPYIRMHCKGFHFSVTYRLIRGENPDITELNASKLNFFIKDAKTDLVYHILSDYEVNKTSVHFSSKSSNIQEITTSLVGFDNFKKKAVVKKIRALALLS